MSHEHHHDVKDITSKKMLFSVGLNLLITIAEIIGGIVSNSLSLLSDSLHNLNDTLSIFLGYLANKISKRPKDLNRTYGYKRFEIIAAFLNTVFLMVVATYLVIEGIKKFYRPEIIDGRIMLIISVIGLIGNLITALLLFKEAKANLNVKAVFVHIASDTLSSVLIIVGAIFIYKYKLYFLDPLFTLLISGYIGFESYHLLKETVNILIQGVPKGINLENIKEEIETLPFVADVHHIHVWTTDGKDNYLECHVSLKDCEYDLDTFLKKINEILRKKFNIHHSTIQFEKKICLEKKEKDFVF